MKITPIEIQQEILDLLESNNASDFIKSTKMKQARMIVSHRKKYDFKKKSLGMN